MKLYLIVARGQRHGLPIQVKASLFLIGSERICQLQSNRAGVAPLHCAIVNRERKVFAQDLDSGEPTLVNGDRITPGAEWPLHKRDMLAVGPLEFMIQFSERELSQRDLEEWALKCLDVVSEEEREPEEDEVWVRTQRLRNASEVAATILDKLQVRRGLIKGRLRVSLEGDLMTIRFNDRSLVEEAELALVKKDVYSNLTQPNLRVLLDFKMVRRMSSSAVQMFNELSTWLLPWGSKLAMCRLRPELQSILRTFNLTSKVPLFSDKRTAAATRW
ncbi:MAG TPA: FHA domain-containing protein [Gemmataceae bacterium]|jgi:anti-anti-sigma regulatory factor|nr:FHA domain-containing protein [Gemmataceae bacterium]